MLSITFHDAESVKKNFPEYEADCLVEIKGKEKDVMALIDSLSSSFNDFWGSGSERKFKGFVMVKDFSHFLDFVIEVNNYFETSDSNSKVVYESTEYLESVRKVIERIVESNETD